MLARMRTERFPLGAAVTVEQLEGDPHALLAALREAEPVSWLPAIGGWLVTRRDLALTAMTPASCKARTTPTSALSGINASSTTTARSPRRSSRPCTRSASASRPGSRTSTGRASSSGATSTASEIIAAPTVAFVSPSIRISAPIFRFSL